MNKIVAALAKRFLITVNSRSQIFLLGDGRSGTTWIAQVLNFDGRYLSFSEPFHGREILGLPGNRFYPTAADLDTLGCNSAKLKHYSRLTKHSAGLQKPNRIPVIGSIVKDISSHLILQRIQDHRRKNVLILRNPISVAMSKERYGEWHSARDIEILLSQSSTIQEIGSRCLSQQLVSTKFLEYVFVWSLLHRIVLPVLNRFEFSLVFYENLLREPEQSFRKLFCQLGLRKKVYSK